VGGNASLVIMKILKAGSLPKTGRIAALPQGQCPVTGCEMKFVHMGMRGEGQRD
jgi:hypothetical protein